MTPVIPGLLLSCYESIAAKTATLSDVSERPCALLYPVKLTQLLSPHTPQALHSATSSLFFWIPISSSIISCWGQVSFSIFRCSLKFPFLSPCFDWAVAPNPEPGRNGVFNKRLHDSDIPSADSTLHVSFRREHLCPTHLVLSGDWSRRSSTEAQFTIILVVSKFKERTTKAIKWIRSNLKKNYQTRVRVHCQQTNAPS